MGEFLNHGIYIVNSLGIFVTFLHGHTVPASLNILLSNCLSVEVSYAPQTLSFPGILVPNKTGRSNESLVPGRQPRYSVRLVLPARHVALDIEGDTDFVGVSSLLLVTSVIWSIKNRSSNRVVHFQAWQHFSLQNQMQSVRRQN